MSTKEVIRKLFALLKDYRKTIIVIIGCLLISTALNLYIPLLNRRIMDDGFIGGDKKLLITMVLCSFFLFLLCSCIELLKEKKRIDIATKLQYKLSKESYLHLMRMKAEYFSVHNYSEIMNNIQTDIDNMASIADDSTFFVITQIFGIMGGIIGLFIIDWRMTILVLAFIPVKYVAVRHFAKRRKKAMDIYISDRQAYAGWFGDTIGGVREVKLFGIFEDKKKEFEDRQNKVISSQKEMNMLMQRNSMADVVLVQFLTTMIYIIGADMVFDLSLSIGSVFCFYYI